MRMHGTILLLALLLACCSLSAVRVKTELHTPSETKPSAQFATVQNPSKDDAAQNAVFKVIGGQLASDSAPIDCLHDGTLQGHDDDISTSFFFEWATLEGRIRLDLKNVIAIAQINTYSWHKSSRAPQVYKVYGSDGTASDFDPAPRIGADPAKHGWTRIASVDTRPRLAAQGGQHAVSISDPDRPIGRYRYLLFLRFVTEIDDSWGHTFYSEIDVHEWKPGPEGGRK